MFTFSNLSAVQGVTHGITQKGDELPSSLVYGQQVHKNKAAWVEDDSQEVIKGVDALATRVSGITLGVEVADCVPLIFAEPNMRIIGTIHAGWRGTALEITRKTIEFLKIKPFKLLVGIGPAICKNCFEVGEEVARQFDPSVVQESEQEEGKFTIDLIQANINQCIEVGIPERNIEVCGHCTYEDDTLYSYRQGEHKKRNTGFISMTA